MEDEEKASEKESKEEDKGEDVVLMCVEESDEEMSEMLCGSCENCGEKGQAFQTCQFCEDAGMIIYPDSNAVEGSDEKNEVLVLIDEIGKDDINFHQSMDEWRGWVKYAMDEAEIESLKDLLLKIDDLNRIMEEVEGAKFSKATLELLAKRAIEKLLESV